MNSVYAAWKLFIYRLWTGPSLQLSSVFSHFRLLVWMVLCGEESGCLLAGTIFAIERGWSRAKPASPANNSGCPGPFAFIKTIHELTTLTRSARRFDDDITLSELEPGISDNGVDAANALSRRHSTGHRQCREHHDGDFCWRSAALADSPAGSDLSCLTATICSVSTHNQRQSARGWCASSVTRWILPNLCSQKRAVDSDDFIGLVRGRQSVPQASLAR
jgi:hypothetical protein